MLQQHLDVRKSLDTVAKHVIDRRLIHELLRRMPGPRSGDLQSMNGTPWASTKVSGRSGSMSRCSRSASPTDCQIRITSSSVEIARARP